MMVLTNLLGYSVEVRTLFMALAKYMLIIKLATISYPLHIELDFSIYS